MANFELAGPVIVRKAENTVRKFGGSVLGVAQLLLDVGHRVLKNPTHRELSYAATHDELTKTYNRRGLVEALDSFNGNSTLMGAFIDVKGLGYVNNDYSHELGNHFLMVAAAGVKDNFRLPDGQTLVARIGGDEFAAFIPVGTPTNEESEVRYDSCEDAHTATIDLTAYQKKRVHSGVRQSVEVLLLAGVKEISYRYNIGEVDNSGSESSEQMLAKFLTDHGSKYTRSDSDSPHLLDEPPHQGIMSM